MKGAFKLLHGVLLIPLAIVALLFVAVFLESFLDSRAGNAFERIELGASEAQVIELLGKPDVERPCGQNLYWGGDYDYLGKNDGRCVSEVRYEYFLSAWAIGYGADRRAVSKYHYSSE